MSIPLIVTHPCTLLHDGLIYTFKKSTFRPVRIVAAISDEVEDYIRSLQSCVWLVGVEKYSSATSDLLRRVVTTSPGVKTVILAAHHTPNDVLAALQAGACGFLGQDIPGAWLNKSLELIARDEMVVHPPCRPSSDELKDDTAAEARSGELLHSGSDSSASRVSFARESASQTGCVSRGLTRREILILRSLTEGASNKIIALKLVMTESTVKVHMKTILRKLRLENRTQAAIWARDHANELVCDRAPLGRTGFRPIIEPRLGATSNLDSRRAAAEL